MNSNIFLFLEFCLNLIKITKFKEIKVITTISNSKIFIIFEHTYYTEAKFMKTLIEIKIKSIISQYGIDGGVAQLVRAQDS